MYSSIYTKILHLICLDNDVENGSQAIWVIFLVVELASFPNSETSPDAFCFSLLICKVLIIWPHDNMIIWLSKITCEVQNEICINIYIIHTNIFKSRDI